MSKEDNLTDQEKFLLAVSGLEGFIQQFGEDDPCRAVALEILMETLYGEDIHLPREEGQVGDEDHHDDGGEMPTYEID